MGTWVLSGDQDTCLDTCTVPCPAAAQGNTRQVTAVSTIHSCDRHGTPPLQETRKDELHKDDSAGSRWWRPHLRQQVLPLNRLHQPLVALLLVLPAAVAQSGLEGLHDL